MHREVGVGATQAAGPTPTRFFHREAGEVWHAVPVWNKPPHFIPRPRQAAKKNGLRFEKAVHVELTSRFPRRYISHLTFQFSGSRGTGWAIPDGLLFDPAFRQVTVVEIKLRHSGDGYKQLHQFYIPIIRKAWPTLSVVGVEICQNFEPSVRLPTLRELVHSPEVSAVGSAHKVLIWGKAGLGRVP